MNGCKIFVPAHTGARTRNELSARPAFGPNRMPVGSPLREAAMPVKKLKEFLDSQNIHYSSIPHSTAYTAQGIAAVTHISGKELAKTVMVKLDDELVMAVLPASQQVDLDMLKAATKSKTAATASEREFREKFP